METRKVKIVRAIEQTPIVFGYAVDKVMVFSVILLCNFFVLLKILLLGVLFFGLICLLIYLYVKGYISERAIFYQKFRYLVFNKYIKQKQ